NVFASDESFFHTILGNSPFRTRMRRNLVYALWPGPANGHPAWISPRQVYAFELQDAVSRDDTDGPGELLFARKFSDSGLHIIDRIDRMIERKERIELPVS